MNRVTKWGPLLALGMLALAGCGGGGVAAGRSGPTPAPTASPRSYQVHRIVSLSGSRNLEVHPANVPPVAPPGATIGTPADGANVRYPDGSIQLADGSGRFTPASSTYAINNRRLLETRLLAQPQVIVSDPVGKSNPTKAYVSAYGSATVAAATIRRRVASAVRAPRDTGTSINLAGVQSLPDFLALFSGEYAVVEIEGLDDEDHVASLDAAQITWSAQLGTIFPLAGSNEALYVAPVNPGAGTATDVITASVSLPGSPLTFTSTTRVLALGSGSGVGVSGSLAAASGTLIPNAAALFAQANLPRVFAPVYWLAGADDSARYARLLPANALFTTVMGAGAPFAPGADFDYFVASLAQGGGSAYRSGAPGSQATLDLLLTGSLFINPAELDSLPPPISQVRDAWYGTAADAPHDPYEADSGLQPLLAAPPSSFPSPLATVPSGQFAGWCYQWQSSLAGPSLVLVQNAGASCSNPGNQAFTITPGAAGTYQFAKYALAVPYIVSSPLNAAPSGAFLAQTGSWTQAVSMTGATVSSESASVQRAIYDSANQTVGSPLLSEQLQYTYSLGANNLATVQIGNDTLTDFSSGHVVSIYSATKTQAAPLNGSGGCMAPSSPVLCYTVSGALARNTYVSDGIIQTAFAIDERLYGDGSATLTYANSSATDRSKVVISIANYRQQSAGNCLVCAPNLGALFDSDGTTQIGQFAISTAGLVTLDLLDPSGSTPGGIVDTLTFIL